MSYHAPGAAPDADRKAERGIAAGITTNLAGMSALAVLAPGGATPHKLHRRYAGHMGIADGIGGGIGLISFLSGLIVTNANTYNPNFDVNGVTLGSSLVFPIALGLSGPIVHLIHGHPDRAALSLLMRAAPWALGLGVAFAGASRV